LRDVTSRIGLQLLIESIPAIRPVKSVKSRGGIQRISWFAAVATMLQQQYVFIARQEISKQCAFLSDIRQLETEMSAIKSLILSTSIPYGIKPYEHHTGERTCTRSP
jgi:hypothetical protein